MFVFQAELSERIAEVEDDSVDSLEPPAIPQRVVGVVRPTSIANEATILRRKLTARNYENVAMKDTKIFSALVLKEEQPLQQMVMF